MNLRNTTAHGYHEVVVDGRLCVNSPFHIYHQESPSSTEGTISPVHNPNPIDVSLRHSSEQLSKQQSLSRSFGTILCRFSIRKAVSFLFGVLAVLSMMLLIAWLYQSGINRTDDNMYRPNPVYLSYEVVLKNNGAVILLGDSLVDVPSERFDLMGKLRRHHNYSLGYTNCGIGGNSISKIRARIGPLLSNIRKVTGVSNATASIGISAPTNKNSSVFVILFWQTDASDISEVGMSTAQVASLRDAYKTDLRMVIQHILAAGAYMAIAGPEVVPWFKYKTFFQILLWLLGERSDQLDAYRQMNIDIASEVRMQYIDVRSAFLTAMKSSARSPTIYLDAEHPNNYGTEILARLFGQAIRQWKS